MEQHEIKPKQKKISVIKPEDLRIGNFLTGGSGYYKVNSIDPIGGKDFILGDGEWRQFPDSCQPIPISDQWLEMFGFEKKTGSATGIGDYHWYEIGQYETVHVYKNWIKFKDIDSTVIKYVHQLQNLYFALTGQELTINHTA